MCQAIGEITLLICPISRNSKPKVLHFMDAHGTPKCAPSRYMLLSVNYHHRGRQVFGSWGFEDEDTQFLPCQKSIAKLLQGQGYKTGMLGKWHVGGRVPGDYNKRNMLTCCNLNWTKPITGGPNDVGFDESYVSMSGLHKPFAFFQDRYMTTKEEDRKKGTVWETAK